jgi:hypothetical protein
MPVFKVSSKLNKTSVMIDLVDKTAHCEDCTRPSTKADPVISLGLAPDGIREIFSHVNCPSANDRKVVAEEERNREIHHSSAENNPFAFADRFRHIATDSMVSSTVEQTFPTNPQSSMDVQNMTTKQVDANYDSSGTPVPPKN